MDPGCMEMRCQDSSSCIAGEGKVNLCWEIWLVKASIPDQVDQGFGIFVSGNHSAVGED
jgi:hypothetical protein